jgi:hypothetical protein
MALEDAVARATDEGSRRSVPCAAEVSNSAPDGHHKHFSVLGAVNNAIARMEALANSKAAAALNRGAVEGGEAAPDGEHHRRAVSRERVAKVAALRALEAPAGGSAPEAAAVIPLALKA